MAGLYRITPAERKQLATLPLPGYDDASLCDRFLLEHQEYHYGVYDLGVKGRKVRRGWYYLLDGKKVSCEPEFFEDLMQMCVEIGALYRERGGHAGMKVEHLMGMFHTHGRLERQLRHMKMDLARRIEEYERQKAGEVAVHG